MQPLAKLWTWLGNYFLPLAVAWVYFIRNGPDEGVKISRGYWGLAITLAVGILLTVTLALYVREARKKFTICLPPNTTFETEDDRNFVISWGSLVAYVLAVLIALIAFGSRYADSQIHEWDKNVPLAPSFWGSRILAWKSTCADTSCFAIGNRFGTDGKPLEYVDQYLPLITDPALLLLALFFCGSIFWLLMIIFRPRPVRTQTDY